jgi:DNA-binding transcriptional LysR family regulator
MTEASGRVTLWGVEVFLTVAEEGSISAAARRLGVSASAISQQLAGIEAALGAALLDRSNRPLALTSTGVVFRPHAQAMLNAEAEARAALARVDLRGLVTLRLGVIEDFDAQVTPRLLSALARDLPGCRFILETGPSHRLLDMLETRALDIAVTAEYGPPMPPEPWREVHPLMQEPFVAVLPLGSDFAAPFIQYTTRHLMGRQIAAHLAAEGLAPAQRFELDSYRAILSMVAEGEGWSILTPLALDHGNRFMPAIRVEPLPTAPMSRRLSLSARAGALGDVPHRVADLLRGMIAALVLAPLTKDRPEVARDFRLFDR